MAVDEDPVGDVELHAVGKHPLLDVAALGDEVVHGVLVRDRQRRLVDDRAFIEVDRGEMRRGAYDFHPPLESLVVGFGALEGRQERVVDVDNAVFVTG